MVSLSNHEAERVEAWGHNLVVRQAHHEIYFNKKPKAAQPSR